MIRDVLVLGCGPAGYYCAMGCARAGLRTAVVERDALGGTGLRWGCLPVKMLLDGLRRTAPCGLPALGRAARRLGAAALERTARAMLGVERRLERDLSQEGVELVRGEAGLLDSHTVQAGDARLEARTVVIATGTRAAAPEGTELDGSRVIGHAELLGLARMPESVAVIGGDVEGVELACLLAHYGVQVELFEKELELLPGQDRDLVRPIEERLLTRGVRLRLGCTVQAVQVLRTTVRLRLLGGEQFPAELALATGLRRPNLPQGLDRAGVSHTAQRIPVDEDLRTSAPDIYAIGDINGLCGLANAAIRQGIQVAGALAGRRVPSLDYTGVVRAVYTLPEIAGAGFQERELQRQGVAYSRAEYSLPETWRGIARRMEGGLIKVLTAPDGRVLGAWLVGEEVSETAALLGLLLERGLTAQELLEGLIAHPTLAEGLREAAWRLSL
jgi:dihydrolipoamide dehydrogenase